MKKYAIIILVILSVFVSSQAQALETQWRSADYVQARLLSSTEATGEQKNITAAFDMRLSEGWHAYWRMPGDGGLPPRFNWEDSKNVDSISVIWPLPQRFETYGFYSFGYKNTALLPLDVQLTETGKSATLNLQAEIMVCKDICVPQKISLHLKIPAGAAEDSVYVKQIAKAQKDIPHKGDLPGLKIENAVIGPEAVVVTAFSQSGYENADLYIEAGDLYVTAVPDITIDEKESRRAIIRIAAPEGIENLAEYIMGESITLTLTNGRYAIEKTISF